MTPGNTPAPGNKPAPGTSRARKTPEDLGIFTKGADKGKVETLTKLKRDDAEARKRPLSAALYKRMLHYTKPYKHILFWLMVTVVTRAVQGSAMGWSMSAVLGGPIKSGNAKWLFWGASGYALLVIFTYWVLYYRLHLGLLIGEGVVHDLRDDIFSHLQRQTMGFYNKTKIGRIISRMLTDAEAIRAGVQEAVFVGIVNVGMVACSLSLMLWTDHILFGVILLMGPAYFCAYHYFRSRLSDAHRAAQESMSRITANLAESVNGVRVTQGYSRQDLNAEMFSELAHDHSLYNIDVSRANGRFLPLLEFLGQLTVALILVAGGWRVLGASAAAFPAITTFYILSRDILGPIAAIGNQYNTAVASMAGAERVFRLLDRKPDFVDDPDAIDLPPIQGKVELKNLSFGYDPEKLVLHDVNFTAKPGQSVALVGHTGSGKSSIINLIARFYLPTKGQLLIDGYDITKIRADSLHTQMGIVLQSNFLFTGSVLDNIAIGKRGATREQVIEAAKKLGCLDMFEALPQGFDTLVGERGAGLSLGQRQLVCFTRAMLADPRIMILDEATSSVDTMTEARIQAALAVLLDGRTSFIVAHRLSTIRHASVVLVLNHGRIVERGTHNDLLATGGIYSNLYMQFIKATKA